MIDPNTRPAKDIESHGPERLSGSYATYAIAFSGSNDVMPIGYNPMPASMNFFIGNDSSRWAINPPCFSEIRYADLYDGIDLVFHHTEAGLKYEFIVQPNARLDDIRLRYEGAGVTTDGETLYVHTPIRTIADTGLVFFELHGEDRTAVPGRVMVAENTVTYYAEYDDDSTLIVDPLLYSTYLGGGYRFQTNVKLDSKGNIIIAGSAVSQDIPITPGTYTNNISGMSDPFVYKFGPNASSLIFSTRFGGVSDDWCPSLIIDSHDNILLSGATESLDFPVTSGAYCTTMNGIADLFILKLANNGSELLFSTYFGGDSADYARSMTLNADGDIFITGYTASQDFPTTPDAFVKTLHKDARDSFVLIFNSAGTKIIYSTFIAVMGGTEAYEIALDSTGAVYVSGTTTSSSFPTTQNAYSTTKRGYRDIFIFKIHPGSMAPDYSTYIGGEESGVEYVDCLAVDSQGNAYIAGGTPCSDFPVTDGAFDETFNVANASRPTLDAYILKLNPEGSGLVYSTFVGGEFQDQCYDIELLPDGSVMACGETMSEDFPVTADAYQTTLGGGRDAFILRLAANGSAMKYSSHFGQYCYAQAMACPSYDKTYITGVTYSSYFPVTPGAYDTTYNDGYNAFISILGIVPSPTAPSNLTAREGYMNVDLEWSPPGFSGESPIVNYSIYRGSSAGGLRLFRVLGNVTAFNDTNLEPAAEYFYAVAAYNSMLWSDLSNIVKAIPGVPPGPPEALNYTPGENSINLSWEPPPFDGGFPVTSYRIYRGEAPEGLSIVFQTAVKDYFDRGVPYGSRFYYAVSAMNQKGEGPLSEVIGAYSGGRPFPPLNPAAHLDGNRVLLTWDFPDDDGGFPVLSFNIYRLEVPGEYSIATEVNASETSWRDGPFFSIKDLHYYITAINELGESDPSAIVSVFTNNPPGSPLGFEATLDNRAAVLRWDPPRSDGGTPITHYRIFRGEESGPTNLLNATSDNTPGFTDTTAKAGRTYYYRVSAVNAVGEGPVSDDASIITDGTPPELSVSSPKNESNLNISKVRIYGNASDGWGLDIVDFSLDEGEWTPCEGKSNWSAALNLAEGAHSIRIRAIDLWGNEDSAQLTVTIDLTAPAISITKPAMDAVVSDRAVGISGTASDNLLLSGIELSKDGTNWTAAIGSTNWSGNLNYLPGHRRIHARSTDAAGNTAATQIDILVDLGAPNVTIIHPPAGHVISSSGASVISEIRGTARDDTGVVRVEYNLDGKGWVNATGTTSWSARLELEPGKHMVSVRAIDEAGKADYDHVTFTFKTTSTIPEMWPLMLGIAVVFAIVGAFAIKKHLANRRARKG